MYSRKGEGAVRRNRLFVLKEGGGGSKEEEVICTQGRGKGEGEEEEVICTQEGEGVVRRRRKNIDITTLVSVPC